MRNSKKIVSWLAKNVIIFLWGSLLYEGLSVRPSVHRLVGRSVTFSSKLRKINIFEPISDSWVILSSLYTSSHLYKTVYRSTGLLIDQSVCYASVNIITNPRFLENQSWSQERICYPLGLYWFGFIVWDGTYVFTYAACFRFGCVYWCIYGAWMIMGGWIFIVGVCGLIGVAFYSP